jgi:hypothetical protein
MNRAEIITAAQAYMDRYDDELVGAMSAFFSIVEAKVNTALKTGAQAVRSQIPVVADQEYYALPCDFGGFRDVELVKGGQGATGFGGDTLSYASPEFMNGVKTEHGLRGYYTVIANQLQIRPAVGGDLIEVVYYQKVPSLIKDEDSNWLSENHPDAYIFGVCTEIAAFAKDELAYTGYDTRFKASVTDIIIDDQVTRWSGPTLQMQVDGLIV